MQAAIITDQKQTAKAIDLICHEAGVVRNSRIFEELNLGLIFMINNQPDIVFLDLDLFEAVDANVIKLLQHHFQESQLVVIADSQQYALAACCSGAISYLLKPIQSEEVEKALLKAVKRCRKEVFIRTFGHFDVYIENELVHFRNLKAKELLAILVDSRGTVSMETAVNILWETRIYDEKVKQLYRKAVSYLNNLFKAYDVTFFVANRGSCHIKTNEITCDFYQFLEGSEQAVADYHGQYMFQYAWAEETHAQIEKRVRSWEMLKKIRKRQLNETGEV